MIEFIFFIILSIPIIFLSQRSLMHPLSHGFYRFFSWECILWLFINNYKYWFVNPFSIAQIFSWILLIISLFNLIPAIMLMKKIGKQNKERSDSSLYSFEKTSALIQTGIFKYIRHPMYSSLLFLTWGICLKNPELFPIIISVLSTIFLFITAKIEEKEDILYFGNTYKEYMKRSKLFIPYLY
ncbi:MAG: isoprenylcysteine carboxylmethyltransferase family protein [Ignavibacteriae bacterium]|nr:MAG: isoprenylcysteine carboxylmethyltransferase family protein [Ignavibacteriota bacterium]